ncbi:FtsK/SpoIIIE domain-containing protein [Phycicoccus duodecadis]|uniref:S-DNA-T family DNA segregation ATPase FtsK/SpoIIIE n=1 Tax=Phycicoccus duodecadis TaxID=173053 RepID=A0A2N3YIN3_9MICO|nr:FtsK/SpoIIIE domain-containing protein [Phycicoccus duodecadis]PKW26678.1 S-DNA-T family DNA segregation ATPase FtsK/SpoIIIE [Phycicoccus duodecadis]
MRTRSDDIYVAPDDPLSIVLEAVVRATWLLLRLVAAVVKAAARNVGTATILVVVAATVWLLNLYAAGGLVVIVAAALTTWRFAHRASFTRQAAPRLILLWRAPLYRVRWRHVATRCGLVIQPHGMAALDRSKKQLVPHILRVVVDRSGRDRLLLRLPVGMTPDDVAAHSDAVGHAFGVDGTQVVTARPGRAWLELRRCDPLRHAIRPEPAKDVALAGIPVGLGDDGRIWRFRVQATHALIAGATGAGKGSVLWSLVHGLAPAISDGWVQVWALDPKGGMELGLGRGAFARFEGGSPEAMCDLLEEAVDLKTRRSLNLATHGKRVHQPSAESPHLVIVIDELATLSAFAERTVVRRIEHALGLLLTQGRAVGITVIAAVQDPGKDVVSWRDLFPTRIAMRLDNPIQVDMVLGDGARERGARADHISELTPGVAYVRIEGSRDVRRVRSAYLTDEDVLALSTSLSASKDQNEREQQIRDREGEAA